MDPGERIKRAHGKAEQLSKYIIQLLQTRQNNEMLIYSSLISDQIRPSFAAHAYNNLIEITLLGEIVRLCALWDSLDLDKFCIPTIIVLIDDAKVQALLFRRFAEHAKSLPN